MRYFSRWLSFALSFGLFGCATIVGDQSYASLAGGNRTRVTFAPLTREQAKRYLEAERHTFKVNTDPMLNRKTGLVAGRETRWREISKEFPDCDRQMHCLSQISRGSVQQFERFNELAKEIYAYDKEIAEIDIAVEDWQSRLDLRSRAILNRFVVHEVLQLPTVERRFQGVLVYSLESFETKRQLATRLFQSTGQNLEPRVIGDFDFRMLGRPLDEAAVIASFEVYLMPPLNDFSQPTRYVVTMLVNAQQLDLRYYDKDFLRPWAAKLSEAFQASLKEEAPCGVYAIASETFAPRISLMRPKKCVQLRNELRGNGDPDQFKNRFAQDRWIVPLAYFATKREE